MRKFTILLLIVALPASLALAAGFSIGEFGGRAAAMGNAYVALANDVTALYWNPAGITKISGTQFGLSYTNWILDINHSFFGIVRNLGELGTIGVSFNYL